MRNISTVLAAVAVAGALALADASAQSRPDHRDHQDHGWGSKGQEVRLTACVERGQNDDTFILTDVADVPVHPATMGRVVYWLNTVKDVKKHVGRQIRIEAEIDKVEQSEIEVKSGDDDGDGWYVEIEGPGRDVRTDAANVGVSTAGRKDEEDDIKTTLVRLKVDDVTRVADSCPAR
jgi:hypothetical protein